MLHAISLITLRYLLQALSSLKHVCLAGCSWDVIEPITYFLGSGTTILFYCYFMVRPDQEQAAACMALLDPLPISD